MEEKEIFLSGPKFFGPEYLGSIAEFLIPKLKLQPKDFIIQVDCDTNETITSHEFLKQSLEVTEGLQNFGLKQGDVVILASSNNIRSNIAAAGVLFSEGVLTPIDRNLKHFELQHIFNEFHPKYIICETSKSEEIQTIVKSLNFHTKIILLDSSNPNGEFVGLENIRTKVDVDNYIPRKVQDPKKSLALISCSSGTTGMPKGVALSHYSILFTLSLMQHTELPNLSQRLLMTSPLFWISGSLLMIQSTYFGWTRYTPKSAAPEDILEGIQMGKPIILSLSPASMLSIAEHPNFEKYDISSVKVILSIGARLSAPVVTRVKKIWKSIKITNCYGLTETCGGLTIGSDSKDPTSVGKVLPDVQIKVVDVDTGKSLGPNEIGEFRVKAKTLMNGYYNNEKVTKAAFDEKGWFRTGDLVYYNEDGWLYVVGRIKEIIKNSNYQISPAELEGYIIGLPGVKDVAVVPVPRGPDSNHLGALVVKDPNFDISAEEIIQGVKENFIEQKHLTEGVQFVDALPRSEVGKLKRFEAVKLLKL